MKDLTHPAPARVGIQYPCAAPPEPGVLQTVMPGVSWARMPLPVALGAINVWLLVDDDGQALVDTGIYSNDSVTIWERLLDGPLSGENLTRVLVTHLHPDHIGMAGWLGRRTGCRLWMTRTEYLQCRTLAGDTGRSPPDVATSFYLRAGWDQPALQHYHQRFGNFGRMLSQLPDSYRRIRDGELLRIGEYDWEVVVGTGHSPEHACLYDAKRKLLISGDQVLPRISSNVSVYPGEPDADPMADWLESLAGLRQRIPDDVLVLPSHNEPFYGLHQRIDQLEASALKGLDRLRNGLHEPRRAIDVFPLLFSGSLRTEDTMTLTLATGESLAHLNYLVSRKEISVDTDDQGVAWYRRT